MYSGIFLSLGLSNFAKVTNSAAAFIALACAFFVTMMTATIVGAVGNLKQNAKLLIVYVVIVWAVFAGFWVTFGICLVKKDRLNAELQDFCNNRVASKFAGKLQSAYGSDFATAFCSSECPCASDKKKFPSSEYSSAVFDATGALNIMGCPKSLYKTNRPKDYVIDFMRNLERRYECSGLCTREKWFYFHNVDKGPPLYSCQESIVNYVAEIFVKIYGIVLACATITLFVPIPAVMLICIKNQRVQV